MPLRRGGARAPDTTDVTDGYFPVLRFGHVLRSSKMLSNDAAYDIGEAVFDEPLHLANSFHDRKLIQALRDLGVTKAKQNPGKEVNYQITPTITLNFASWRLQGPIQYSTQARSDVDVRLSLTVCPGTTKSKLWLRLQPTQMFDLDACRNFYKHAREIAAVATEHLISTYNQRYVNPVSKVSLEPYFQISICAHETTSAHEGAEVRREVLRDRSPDRAGEARSLSKRVRNLISDDFWESQSIPEVRRVLSFTSTRSPSSYEADGYAVSDAEETNIYILCQLSVFDQFATATAVCFEQARVFNPREPATSLIASADLATEFGSAY